MTTGAETARGIDRRGILALGGVALAMAGGIWAWPRLRPLPFEAVAGVPGLRRLGGPGALSAGGVATLGLGGSGPDLSEDVRRAAAEAVSADPVRMALDGRPIAFFTAGGCPYCAPQAERLAGMGLPVTLRPLALFGAASERAARAIIAAGPDGWALHDRLVGTPFQTEDAFIRIVAEDMPGDADALLDRMDAPGTDAALATNHALAARLGIPGTPSTLIGGTLVAGLAAPSVLARIVEAERARG